MPATAEIEATIVELVRRQLKAEEPIGPETRFREDLGADSLDMVELVFEVEQAFGITVPDGEVARIRTVEQAVEAVRKAVRP